MATIVSDSFNRANSSSLGTADTGQVWTQTQGVSGTFSISSNTALWTWNPPDDPNGMVLLETGFSDAISKVTLVNPTSGPQNFAEGHGLVFRYVDPNFFWMLVYYKFPGPGNRLRMQRTYAGSTATILDFDVTLSDGDAISVAYCDVNFEVFINDVSQGTYDDSNLPRNYGTVCGLVGTPGTYFLQIQKSFDNFLVSTNGTCTPTYNCTGGACVDPGDGTGTYPTLAACLAGCSVAATYNCINGQCFDPGDGSGTFPSLSACEESGCGATSRGQSTVRFDEGEGNFYYLVAPIVDSGNELRSKTVKSVRVTGKKTNASTLVYGYDVETPINVSDLESGLNSTTGAISLTDSTQVTQSERQQVNVPNAVLHTVRVQGDDTGEDTRDRIDEIVTEQADQGVRR